ncbi:hypothetical protein N8813_04655 [bacterium]|nr:hypothetical protein [bacterium]MDC0258862.1 hypothetical protein [Verrucomicrobiales bacterium]MDC0314682.1 hypothetical protein [bacterium]
MSCSARENPFEVTRVESLISFEPTWLNTSWEAILARFGELDFRATIVGPHGSGKSTFLDDFESKLKSEGDFLICRLFLNDEKKSLTQQEKIFLTNCPNHGSIIIFLDGEEQMSYLDRLEFTRVAHGFAGLLTTSHKRKRGTSVLLETKTTPMMLSDFIQRLAPDFSISDHKITDLFEETDGNIREALRKAYDLVASAN